MAIDPAWDTRKAKTAFIIGTVSLDDKSPPDPPPKNIEWHKGNVVEVEKVPGKGKKFITVRTSDGVLWECNITVRSVTDKRYRELKALVDDGGPFLVQYDPHGKYKMYITEGTSRKREGDAGLSCKEYNDDGMPIGFMNVAEWDIKLIEFYEP